MEPQLTLYINIYFEKKEEEEKIKLIYMYEFSSSSSPLYQNETLAIGIF